MQYILLYVHRFKFRTGLIFGVVQKTGLNQKYPKDCIGYIFFEKRALGRRLFRILFILCSNEQI